MFVAAHPDEVVLADLINRCDTEQRHVSMELIFQNVASFQHASQTRDRGGIEKGSADKNEMCAKCERLDDICPAPNAAIEHDGDLVGNIRQGNGPQDGPIKLRPP